MKRYEYKVVSMPPAQPGWARDPSHFESALNHLAKDGWVVISCSTTSTGSVFWHRLIATAVLQREIVDARSSTS